MELTYRTDKFTKFPSCDLPYFETKRLNKSDINCVGSAFLPGRTKRLQLDKQSAPDKVTFSNVHPLCQTMLQDVDRANAHKCIILDS